jgi:hypothetical protein
MNGKKAKARHIKEHDLAQDRMGNNSLQGEDQRRVRNQRHAVPDAKSDADDVIESFNKLDREKRARTDLGKGNRDGARTSHGHRSTT